MRELAKIENGFPLYSYRGYDMLSSNILVS
jgi:hypothetical protein